ncbi:efflux transporter outer membrane subunit [Dryocola clanedunensis]|uniref:efflux transporter outer membrane subunit n=1 Tax=Cedecea sulfonylureivorans TaxID=3051154 RepID=UPI001925269F|nr:efflux transporter outer membrane subunit [Cedecea sulfonylureivorans]
MKNSMMLHKYKPLSVLLCMLLTSCALMNNDDTPLKQIQGSDVVLPADLQLTNASWPQEQWWKTYRDPQLDALIDRAIKNSPSMALAHAKVQQARSDVQLIESGSNLKIFGTASIDRAHVSSNGYLGPFANDRPALGLTGPWYTEGIVGLGATLDIDIWGEHRSQLEAGMGVQNARKLEASAVSLEISADTAQLYYAMQTAGQLIALLEEQKAIESYALQSHEARAARGLESRADAEAAKAHLLTVEQQISSAKQQRVKYRESLRLIVGGGELPELKPVSLPVPSTRLPASLNYQLLARRPDLQAAHWYVKSSMSQIDAAKAAFYPKFDIKAFFGFDALHLDDLFNHASQQINIVPGLYLPIFSGGQLEANLDKTRRQRDIMISQYNQAVLTAVRDVAVVGSEMQSLNEEAELQQQKITAASFTANNAAARFRRGLISKEAASTAGSQLVAEKIKQLTLNSSIVSSDIVLNKALGGGKTGK